MAKKTTTRYRDSRTGKFVSAKTWKASHARGGTRYKRVQTKPPHPTKTKPAKRPEPRPPQRFKEVAIKTSYKARKGGGQGGGRPTRPLLVDIRVIVPEEWSAERIQREVMEGIKSGHTHKGVTIRGIDWARGTTGKITHGGASDLKLFSNVLTSDKLEIKEVK